MLDINQFLKSHGTEEGKKHDTVISHTKMEGLIFKDKKQTIDENYKGIDYTIEELEKEGQEKLQTFPSLTQDLFNMFYKISPANRDSEELSENANRFNRNIVDKVKDNSDYSALKLLTEGKDFESIEATREFAKNLHDNLDSFLDDMTGDRGVMNQIDKLEQALKGKVEQLKQALDLKADLLAKGKTPAEMGDLEGKIKAIAGQVEGMQKKIEKFDEIIKASTLKNQDAIEDKIDSALRQAIERVGEVSDTLEAWGTGNGESQTVEQKTELLNRVKGNRKFKEMSKIIGRMRKLAKAMGAKAYTHGRGERVGIEFGNQVSKVLPSELALLATPETSVLFYKKYTEKKLKQYQEKAPEYKGRGHMIVCVDESGSTQGGKEYWAKALSLALLDVAKKDNRNFAHIPFNDGVGNVTEVSADEADYQQKIWSIANNFMSGGTNFAPPLEKAMELLMKDEYHNADLVFITDGHAPLSKETLKRLTEFKEKKKTKIIGILLDKGGNVSDLTLKTFANKVYKTSMLSEDSIAETVLSEVI